MYYRTVLLQHKKDIISILLTNIISLKTLSEFYIYASTVPIEYVNEGYSLLLCYGGNLYH